jgi:hypothetical protein
MSDGHLTSCRCIAVAAAVAAAALAGCAWAPPKPWEKDLLSRPSMEMNGDTLARRFTDHVHESRENAFGGQGVSAGGCGCN